MNKLLIDTNIFIYAMNADSQFHSKSVNILNLDSQLYTTSLNISEYLSVASKMRIKHKVIWGFFKSIKENIEILYPNHKSFQIFEKLINRHKPAANHVYDVEIISIMLANGIKEVATFNDKDFTIVEEINIFK